MEFESAVLKLEGVVIRIRAPVHDKVGSYDYSRQAKSTTSVTEWLNTRIYPNLNDREVSMIDGKSLEKPHGLTKLGTLRKLMIGRIRDVTLVLQRPNGHPIIYFGFNT